MISLLFRKFWKNQRGVSTVEFAIVANAFLLLLLGIFEVGRLYWFSSTLQYAVDMSGRYLMIHTSSSDSTITSQVTSNMTTINPSNIAVVVTSATNAGTTYKTISATCDAAYISGLMPQGTIQLAAQTTVPVIP